MSAHLQPHLELTPEAYLQGEARSQVRHEYLGGHVYAMAGASVTHNVIAGNVFASIHSHLRGRKCRAFTNDMKVRIPYGDKVVFYYPDVLVACNPHEVSPFFREFPVLIVEVLSDETEQVDRREKFVSYTSIPSLQTYVLVDQKTRAIEVFRRGEGNWSHEMITEGVFPVPDIGFEMTVDEIYEDTDVK
jgi:Uma2 family endonuclease